MAQVLTPVHAFKSGSDLWFLPEKTYSQWTKQLDWYLNFLCSQHIKKNKKELSPEIKTVIRDEEVHFDFDLSFKNHVLLLGSQTYLPNKACVIVQNIKNTEEWFEHILSTTQTLKSYNIRVFLPKGLSAKDATPFLKKFPENIEVTFVEEGQLPL